MEKPWQVIAAFVVIFIAGAATGSLITLRVARQLAPQRPAANAGIVDQFAPAQLRLIAQQLDLTKEQREQIGPILQRAGEALRRLRRDTAVESRDIFIRMHDSIAAVLTPEQKAKFEEIRHRQLQRLQEQMQDRTKGRQGMPPAMRPKANPDLRGEASPPAPEPPGK